MEAGYNVERIPYFDRDTYSSTVIREKMLKGKEWAALVPKIVREFILEIDGVNRLRDLARTDSIA